MGGDVVAVQLLDQNSWSAPAEVVLEDEGYDPGDTLESDKECLAKALKSKDKQPTGINAWLLAHFSEIIFLFLMK